MPRSVNFMVRLTPDEARMLDVLAERIGESKSVVVRQAIRELAARQGVRQAASGKRGGVDNGNDAE